MSELKNCPFCGDEPELRHSANTWEVSCTQCDFGIYAADKKVAIEDWNKRVEPQWFKTSKPLSDGDYGHRMKPGSLKTMMRIKNGREIYDGGSSSLGYVSWGKGEWCLIKFPD